jgi:hypothetical protein
MTRYADPIAALRAVAAADPEAATQAALADLQADALSRAEIRRLDLAAHPHDDDCPGCGRRAWTEDDPQRCGACGTRICPQCGADFAEDYAGDGTRTTDCLGEHVTRWHDVPRWAAAVMAMIDADIAAGHVPPGVASFTALHDYRDANEYVIRALDGAFPVPEHYGDEYHDGSALTEADLAIVDAETAAANAVMALVDRHLAARASGAEEVTR